MTTTTIETHSHTEELTVEEPALTCEGLKYINYDCPKEPVYVMETSCCQFIFYWCEGCLFEYIDFADYYQGEVSRCAYCLVDVTINPNHVRVVRKLN